MNTEKPAIPHVQTLLSLLTIAIGLLLLMWMVLEEGEPGAIPLLLIAFGGAWYFLARRRARSLSDRY